MRAKINLSSQPFRQDRPIVAGTIAVSVLLLLTFGLLVMLAQQQDKDLAETRRSLLDMQKQESRLTAELSTLEGTLRKPENAEVLDRSLFLNGLLVTKGVSWTKTFEDLGKVMPTNVKLVAIRPQVFNGNQVRLDMTVAAESAEPIVAFLIKLEGSPVFGATQVYTALPPSEADRFYRYRIGANYAQKL